jgi:hypothetical protein
VAVVIVSPDKRNIGSLRHGTFFTSPPFNNGDAEKMSSAHPAVNQMEHQAEADHTASCHISSRKEEIPIWLSATQNSFYYFQRQILNAGIERIGRAGARSVGMTR